MVVLRDIMYFAALLIPISTSTALPTPGNVTISYDEDKKITLDRIQEYYDKVKIEHDNNYLEFIKSFRNIFTKLNSSDKIAEDTKKLFFTEKKPNGEKKKYFLSFKQIINDLDSILNSCALHAERIKSRGNKYENFINALGQDGILDNEIKAKIEELCKDLAQTKQYSEFYFSKTFKKNIELPQADCCNDFSEKTKNFFIESVIDRDFQHYINLASGLYNRN